MLQDEVLGGTVEPWKTWDILLVIVGVSCHPLSMDINGLYEPLHIFIHYLAGGIPTPLKNMKVSWDDE